MLARSMKVSDAMTKKLADTFSVGDEISIADICLVATVQVADSIGMSYDEDFGCPTIGRIVKTYEGIDAFGHQGAFKVPGVVNLCRSRTGSPVRPDKPTGSWPGWESRSTRSRDINPNTRSDLMNTSRECSASNQSVLEHEMTLD